MITASTITPTTIAAMILMRPPFISPMSSSSDTFDRLALALQAGETVLVGASRLLGSAGLEWRFMRLAAEFENLPRLRIERGRHGRSGQQARRLVLAEQRRLVDGTDDRDGVAAFA